MRINVPGVGETSRTYQGIVAPDIPAAIAQVKGMVITEVTALQKTAD